MNNLLTLLKKEFTIELRRRSVVAGLTIYLAATAFICYIAFIQAPGLVTPYVWSALFWITMLFTAINASTKSFIGEKKGNDIYMYSIASPQSVILSKIVYNFILCFILSIIGFLFFALFLQNPVEQAVVFALTLFLASLGFAASLTLLSGIASKARNSTILMPILSFPLIISILLLVVKLTKNTIDDLDWIASQRDILLLAAINILVTAISYLLFPYIWRS